VLISEPFEAATGGDVRGRSFVLAMRVVDENADVSRRDAELRTLQRPLGIFVTTLPMFAHRYAENS